MYRFLFVDSLFWVVLRLLFGFVSGARGATPTYTFSNIHKALASDLEPNEMNQKKKRSVVDHDWEHVCRRLLAPMLA